MKKTVSSLLGLFACVEVSVAACTANLALQPATTFPPLPGRLIYHSYVNYGDGSSNLFLYDFPGNKVTQLNKPQWNLVDPMNAQFSPDGRNIVFMARRAGEWNVFSWALESNDLPVNLTETHQGRAEDPRFSPDGKRLVIKFEADLYMATLAYKDGKIIGLVQGSGVFLTKDGWTTEQSMPALTPSEKYVVYAQGGAGNSVLYRKNVKSGLVQKLAEPPSGAKDYFPVVRDYSTYFFTRSTPPQAGQTAGYDQLMMLNTAVAGSVPVALPLNDCNSNNSDAAPVDEDYLVFSSGRFNPPYGLVIGEIGSGKVWRLDSSHVNVVDGRQKLGASYTKMR